jgi:hypothetical protein
MDLLVIPWTPLPEMKAVTLPFMPAATPEAAQAVTVSLTNSVTPSARSSIGFVGDVVVGVQVSAWPYAIPANTATDDARPNIFLFTDIKLSPCESE